MIKKRIRPSMRLLLQLEEAKIGDPERIEKIKRALKMGIELPDGDISYLEDLSTQLQKAIEHQMMDDWGRDFTQNLHKKEDPDLGQIKEREEENPIKMDQQLLMDTSSQVKQTVDYEKKRKWTLELIKQLKDAKIGDLTKLDYIERLLQDEKNIEEIDRQYLKEKAQHLKQIMEFKTKITWTADAIKKLQEIEIKHSKRLEAIRLAIESGKIISERDIRYLNARYQKLQRIVEQQNKIDWTISVIEKFEQYGIGKSDKIKILKEMLEDDVPVSENDAKYLREEYKMLKKIMQHKNKFEEITEIIDQLQEMEIGNSERLEAIKKTLKQRKALPESEVNYLAHKCRVFLILKKMEKDGEKNHEIANYKSILDDINLSLQEFEDPQKTNQ